jgi:hypothetical protein
MPEQRLALLIAGSAYDDPKLTPLPSAAKDLDELARVFGSPSLGNFRVTLLHDRPSYEVALALEDFLKERLPDEFVLVHLSGHGIKDADGRLYFACRNTRTDRLLATAIPASMVNDLMTTCRCRRKVLFIDCCYGGAYLRGILPRADRRVGVLDRFPEGRGFVVITSSDALQYAFEGAAVDGKAASSAFTGLVVRGIETGEADEDCDGEIGITELFKYVSEQMVTTRPEQRPEINNFRLQGDICVARSRNIALNVSIAWPDSQVGGERVVLVDGRQETVAFPPGTKDGHRERYAGKGLPAEVGIPAGDLLVTFKVAQKDEADSHRSRQIATCRRLIGLIALGLSLVLVIVPLVYGEPDNGMALGTNERNFQSNIFAVGYCAISILMLSSLGDGRKERIAGAIISICALGIALFSTVQPHDPFKLSVIVVVLAYVRFLCFLIFFSTVVYFCLVHFNKKADNQKTGRKAVQRKRVYTVCGCTIVVSIVLMFVPPLLGLPSLGRVPTVSCIESITFLAFGIAWLVKGGAFLKDGDSVATES